MSIPGSVSQFARRTLENLKIIESNPEKSSDPYVVTQLINSLVGLLVLPNSKFFDTLSAQDFHEGFGGEILASVHSTYKDKKNNPEENNIPTLVKHLRNSVAHFRIKFYSESDRGEITHIEFKDLNPPPPKDSKYEFSVTISVELLCNFLLEFSNAIIALPQASENMLGDSFIAAD